MYLQLVFRTPTDSFRIEELLCTPVRSPYFVDTALPRAFLIIVWAFFTTNPPGNYK